MPDSEEWKNLVATDFKDYKLKIYGLIDNSIELTMEELKKLEREETIDKHSCIQGWTGISQ